MFLSGKVQMLIQFPGFYETDITRPAFPPTAMRVRWLTSADVIAACPGAGCSALWAALKRLRKKTLL